MKTEPEYCKAFIKELPPHLVHLKIHGEGANTLTLVDRAQEIRVKRISGVPPFDHVWIVLDRDSLPAHRFDNTMDKAEADQMHCAWSNEAFELWFILHLEFRNTGMSRTEYEAKLSDLLGEQYRKNAPDMYQKLSLMGNQVRAIAWARKLHKRFLDSGKPPSRANPCTTVFQLVEPLNCFKMTRAA